MVNFWLVLFTDLTYLVCLVYGGDWPVFYSGVWVINILIFIGSIGFFLTPQIGFKFINGLATNQGRLYYDIISDIFFLIAMVLYSWFIPLVIYLMSIFSKFYVYRIMREIEEDVKNG